MDEDSDITIENPDESGGMSPMPEEQQDDVSNT